MSTRTPTGMDALYGMWQRGELKAEGLEAVARVILGLDPGEPRPLTTEEREYMAKDADWCDPAYPYAEGIVLEDKRLCSWWLDAMTDYVNSMF